MKEYKWYIYAGIFIAALFISVFSLTGYLTTISMSSSLIFGALFILTLIIIHETNGQKAFLIIPLFFLFYLINRDVIDIFINWLILKM